MTIERILVVDDDPALRGSLQAFLEDNGHICSSPLPFEIWRRSCNLKGVLKCR